MGEGEKSKEEDEEEKEEEEEVEVDNRRGIEEYEDIAQFRKAHVIKSEREGVYCTSI